MKPYHILIVDHGVTTSIFVMFSHKTKRYFGWKVNVGWKVNFGGFQILEIFDNRSIGWLLEILVGY